MHKTSMFASLVALVAVVACQANFQLPYNGGSHPNFLHNNMNLMNPLMLPTVGLADQCQEIPGVGLPVLVLKKFLIAIDMHLDIGNLNTFTKIIFFKETKIATGLSVKLVVQFVTFTDSFLGAIDGELRSMKNNLPQRFVLKSYHYDTSIENIREVIGEPNMDPNNFVSCGNLKEIYSKFISQNLKPEYLTQNIPFGQTALPLVPPYSNGQPPTIALANGFAPAGAVPFGAFGYNYGA